MTRLLASAGHVRVLRALMTFGAPLGVAQLSADTGLTTRGTRFVLDSLVSQGLVCALGQPRSQVFAVVVQHPLASALKALFEQERTRWEALRDGLRDGVAAQKEIRSAWLYGSVARGEDEPHSDLDIAIVVNDEAAGAADRVRDAMQTLGDKLNVHISVVVLMPAELAKLSEDDPWWSNVVRDAKVLKGVGPSKERLRGARSTQAA